MSAQKRASRWMTKNLLFAFRILSVAVGVWMEPGIAHAESNDRTIRQFVHTAWTAKDGAPGNVLALAQTTDGFLWIGTSLGLYRFDGISFERYEPRSGPAFPSIYVSSLLAVSNGDLWIGYGDKGVSLLRNGRNTNYTGGRKSVPVTGLARDGAGTIWVASRDGLWRFQSDRWQQVGSEWGYSGRAAEAVYVDRNGTLWVTSQGTVVRLPPGSKRFHTTGIEIGQTYQIVESPAGLLWMAETTRSVHPLMLSADERGVEPEIKVGSKGILFDDDGSLWITSVGDGMRRVPAPNRLGGQKIGEFSDAIESFTSKDGLSNDYSTCILKDREDNIWVGTSAGLDRFRKGTLVPVLLPGKLTQKTLVAGDRGEIWAGSASAALARIEGDAWKNVKGTSAILYGFRDWLGTTWFLDALTHPITVRIWRIENGRLTIFGKAPSGFEPFWLSGVLAEDRTGVLWFKAGQQGLFFFKGGRWRPFETPAEVAGKTAVVAFTDAGGRIWFGFTNNTILVVDGSKVRLLSVKDNIQVGTVRAIAGRDRHIWIGGGGGLALWQGDAFNPVVPADEDSFWGVSGVEETSDGSLLVGEQRGVVLIPATEVSKVLQDPSARVQYQIFDVRDGLPGAIQQSGPYPTAVKGTDGRVWFSTAAGVAWIDPIHIARNLAPPPVTIRSISANGTRYTAPGMKFPPGTQDLMIDYTALSLAVPERVRFRYMLEGSDTRWRDAGTRRQAFYTNLSPGAYHFRVIASNNDGVWNETGATWNLDIAPAWYQANWFRLLAIASVLTLCWAAYRQRVRQVSARLNEQFQARLAERTRIANDLHDTLLQSFHGVMFRFQAARNMLPRRPEEAIEALDTALERTEQAIAEGRDTIHGLRASTVATNELAQAVTALGAEMGPEMASHDSAPNSASFRVVVEGPPRDLHPILRDEVYTIAREALRNAFRHAQACNIEVEIRYSGGLFQLRVRDDGIGIDPGILAEGRTGHYGVLGMRERAKRIGGKLDVWTGTGAGTEIELSIPGSIAYGTSPGRTVLGLFRKKTANS